MWWRKTNPGASVRGVSPGWTEGPGAAGLGAGARAAGPEGARVTREAMVAVSRGMRMGAP